MTAPGPTGMPAARSARAKPMTLSAMWPVGGLRWSISVIVQLTFPVIPGRCEASNPESRDSGFTLRVPRNDESVARRFLQNLLQRVALHARDVVLVLQQRAERVADQLRR